MPARLDFEGLPVLLARKRVKNINIRLRPGEAEIRISAPPDVSEARILEILRRHRAWLGRRLQATAPPPDLFPLWGAALRLREREGAPGLEIGPDAAILSLPAQTTPDRRARFLAAWRRAETLRLALPLLELWQRRLGLANVELHCRAMTSRWGSCAWLRNRVTISSVLSEKPRPCLELTLVHELTHFFERGHGPGFYRRLAAALPDWRARRVLLNSSPTPPLPPCADWDRI